MTLSSASQTITHPVAAAMIDHVQEIQVYSSHSQHIDCNEPMMDLQEASIYDSHYQCKFVYVQPNIYLNFEMQ